MDSLVRDHDWTTEKEITEEYFSRNGVKDFTALLDFQMRFSGYTLTKRNKPGDSFTARLLSQEQVRSKEKADFIELANRILFECGDHKTAQFNFYLTNKGQLSTIDNEDNINVISESFDKEVDRYAMHNEISNWIESPYFYEFGSNDNFSAMIADFEKIDECSDQYCSWWTSDELMVVKGIWLDRQEFYIHVYGRSERKLNEFIGEMKNKQIIKVAVR